MSSATTPEGGKWEFTAVFLNSRREAAIIFCVWAAMLAWAVPYCYLNGYVTEFNPQEFQTVLGIPKWVFYGIVVPWLLADVFTTWFCFCYMKDDDLGGEEEEAPSNEATTEEPKS
ncbi:MAG: hypothetical protein CMJ78_09065 [Planctomycetaceae bacterium]|nr:hypothetical protein [Planctomycetaceae bacterium]